MNKTVIVFCKMFDRYSQINFVEDGEIKETITADMDNLNMKIFDLLRTRDCHTVNFKGMKLYAKGIANKLKEYQLNHYTDFNLTINII